MKRAPELVPLSREHHEALVLARRACDPARPHAEPEALRAQVLRRWDEHFLAHFEREEAVLLPALEAAGESHAVAEELAQHQHLRALIARLRGEGPSVLPEWGDAMRGHVQWEERTLFPLAEQVLDLPSLRQRLESPENDTCKP